MKIWKRVLSIGLAAVLAVGLCGCNNGDAGGNGGIGGNGGGNKKDNASAALAKEYVYKLDEFDFSSLQKQGDDIYVQDMEEIDGRIYMILQSNSHANGVDSNTYALLSMDQEGGDLKTQELEMLESDSEETKAEEPMEEGETQDTYEYCWYGNFQFTDGKYIFGSRSYEYSDYSDPENYISERSESVCCWDMDGRMLWNAPMDMLTSQDSWHYINGLLGGEDGSVNVLIAGDECGVLPVDASGNVGDLKKTTVLGELLANSASVSALPDGKVLITYYDSNGTDMYITTYDPASDTKTEPVKLPSSIAYNLPGRLIMDTNGDLVYSNSNGVFKYHPGDEKEQQIMSFVNSDLYVNSLETILPISEEKFAGVYSDYDDDYNRTLCGGIFTKVDPKDIPDKQVMVLGGSYLYGDVQKRVVEYNKSNSEYRIVLKDYSQYNTNEDYTASYTQLNNDIISGKMPDILVVDSYNMSLENYASKGLLADIGSLIEKDEELSKTEFMENVFEACKIDGKLYEVVPSFYVNTYMAKKSLLGDRSGWTMEEAKEFLATMPEGTNLFSDMVRSQFINTVMLMCGNDFVDISTGKCNFDSDEFIALMEFAKELPEEMGDDYYTDDWYNNYASQYRENRTILCNYSISAVQDLVYGINGSMGEDVCFVGFPSSDSKGSIISANTSYALAAGSSNLDAAWDFIRYYLTDEYQSSLKWQLPVNKHYLEENAQEATKKPTYNYDGVETEEDYTYWINDEMIVLDPLTQQQVDDILEFISGVQKREYHNNELTNIITEEMGAFYSGQKSAKDVASIIQSRAQLYVNENR